MGRVGGKVGGIIQVQINGEVYSAKGAFTYNLGRPIREAIVGADSVHGYKETPQPGMIEGEFTDQGDLDMDGLSKIQNATVTIDLANGKMFVLSNAYFAGDGNVSTDESNVSVKFYGDGEEIS